MNEGRKSLALFPVFQSLFKKKNGFISDMKCGGGVGEPQKMCCSSLPIKIINTVMTSKDLLRRLKFAGCFSVFSCKKPVVAGCSFLA